MLKRIMTAAALCALVAISLLAAGCDGDTPVVGDAPDTEEVVVEMFLRGALNQVVDSFEVGQEVRVKDSGTLVGTITAVDVVASRTSAPTSEGELLAAESPVFSDVTLTVEGEAVVSDNGYQFAGRYLYINEEIQYLTPMITFKGIIASMEVSEQ